MIAHTVRAAVYICARINEQSNHQLVVCISDGAIELELLMQMQHASSECEHRFVGLSII